jgi:hypothetical protein
MPPTRVKREKVPRVMRLRRVRERTECCAVDGGDSEGSQEQVELSSAGGLSCSGSGGREKARSSTPACFRRSFRASLSLDEDSRSVSRATRAGSPSQRSERAEGAGSHSQWLCVSSTGRPQPQPRTVSAVLQLRQSVVDLERSVTNTTSKSDTVKRNCFLRLNSVSPPVQASCSRSSLYRREQRQYCCLPPR